MFPALIDLSDLVTAESLSQPDGNLNHLSSLLSLSLLQAHASSTDNAEHKCLAPTFPPISILPSSSQAPISPAPPIPSESATATPSLFSLKIIIFASHRLESLRALIASLTRAVYEDDAVELEIHVDFPPSSSLSAKQIEKYLATQRFIQSISWTQGPFSVKETKQREIFTKTMNQSIPLEQRWSNSLTLLRSIVSISSNDCRVWLSVRMLNRSKDFRIGTVCCCRLLS